MSAVPGAPPLRTVLSQTERPPRPSALSTSLTFAWRGLLKIKHVPEQLFDVTLTPVMFTLMFTYLYGGAIAGSTSEYLHFIEPGILVMAVTFTAVYSGVTMNTDVTKGVVDRFRSLPIAGSSPLIGPVLSDVVRYLVAALVTVALGLALGYRPDGGVSGVALAILLVLVFASALAWAFTALGLVMRTPQAVMNFGFTLLFPLAFLSNGFVDPETMPKGLEAVVDQNPFTHLITAARGLMNGDASGGDISLVLIEAAVVTAIFAPLTVRLYRRKT
jgi:ABC-2 type transport system permease protein